jgi:methyl-accepting chemotaxis protein
MRFADLRVGTKLGCLTAVAVIGVTAFASLAYQTLTVVMVNGPVYERIADAKDLIADVLPPPEYLVESYLNVLQLVEETDATRVQALLGRSAKLKQEYEERHAYWDKKLPEGRLRDAMIRASYGPAMRFFALRDAEFIPAILQGSRDPARAIANGGLKASYDEHRRAIDEVVVGATEQAAAEERSAVETLRTRSAMLVGLALLVVAGVALLSWMIGRAIARNLARTRDVLEAVAAGDFTQQLAVESRDELGQVAIALNQAVDSMREALDKVKAAASHTATASQELSAASAQLSSGAQAQAAALEETAASLEEITGTVKQNADNARQANQLAVGSRDVAEKGGQVVADAVQSMNDINKSSERIADILTTIDEIAFQTNLLALNAAVEAARAGEQGRGFAVVASEVRNLAQRSATAAKEIKGLIQDSGQKVRTGSALVSRSGETLNEIVGSVKRVTDIIAEIAAASGEQSAGIDQVSQAVTQLDQVTQSNAAQTEELSSTAHALAGQAEELQLLVARFKLGAGPAAQSEVVHRTNGHVPTPRIATRGTSPVKSVVTKAAPTKAGSALVAAGAHAQRGNGSAHAKDDGFEAF